MGGTFVFPLLQRGPREQSGALETRGEPGCGDVVHRVAGAADFERACERVVCDAAQGLVMVEVGGRNRRLRAGQDGAGLGEGPEVGWGDEAAVVVGSWVWLCEVGCDGAQQGGWFFVALWEEGWAWDGWWCSWLLVGRGASASVARRVVVRHMG